MFSVHNATLYHVERVDIGRIQFFLQGGSEFEKFCVYEFVREAREKCSDPLNIIDISPHQDNSERDTETNRVPEIRRLGRQQTLFTTLV